MLTQLDRMINVMSYILVLCSCIFACLLTVVGIAVSTSVHIVFRDGLGYPEVRIAIGIKVADGWHPGKWGYVAPTLMIAGTIVGLIATLSWLLLL